MLAYVVITEELDPENRGWGIGALAALGACGHGLAHFASSRWSTSFPMGWRFLYLVGLIPLSHRGLASARSLPETQRVQRAEKCPRNRHGVNASALAFQPYR